MGKYKIFVDGSSGTTGLRIADRLAERDEFEILKISAADRKDVHARAAVINESDLSFLCLPDDAAREVVPLLREDVRILDTSTAHRTAPGWLYGLPELHGTREALKTAIYAQCLLELAGVNPVPRYTADHNDIVTCFDSGSAAALTGFCAGIQHNSPVDSFASPEPADEPGYTDKVVMASGSFTEGSTIEISCAGPLRAPYTCYLQGGVNFTAGRAAVLNAVQNAFFAE